jgi:hypothetical protein
MDTETARLRIARDTHQAEQAVNDALLKQSELFTTIVAARRDTESPAFLGHAELLRLARSQRSLLDVAGGLARVHGGLLKIQQDVTAYDDCPELKPTRRAEGDEPVRLHA